MRRRRNIIGLILLAIAAVVAICAVRSGEPASAKAERIKSGMPRSEVEAILGPPATESWHADDTDESRPAWWTFAEWDCDDCFVQVVFYNGRVERHHATLKQPPWYRLARRVGLNP